MVFVSIGRHLAQARGLFGQTIDVIHGEGHFGLLRNGKQMQHRVGRAAHGNIQAHGV